MWVSGEARGSQEDLILHPGARQLLVLWQQLKGDDGAPPRAALDLRQLRRQAPWLFIAEPAATALDFRYRLAGTGLCALLRQEMTGRDVLTGWPRFERGAIGRALAAARGSLRPVHLRLLYASDRGHRIAADMLAMPVVARDGHSLHLLGGLFPQADPDMLPYDRLVPVQLAAVRLLHDRPEEAHAPRKFRVISGGLDFP